MTTRILIVEDDPDIAELVARYLDKAGFITERATSGREALQAIAARPPDLLVLDLMLPHVDGLEVCRVLRANEATAAMPIIMLTARAEESERIVGLELGADDYLAKPFSPNELVARVRALLRRAHRAAPPTRTLAYGPIALDTDRHIVSSERPRRHADRQGIPAARVSAAAPRTRAVARRAADRRVGLPLHRRHADGGRARAAPSRKAARARRRAGHGQAVRLQAGRSGA